MKEVNENILKRKLTAKQELFCYEYCIDFNATRAAKSAGFSESTSYSIGARLLKNVEIQNRIKKLQLNLSETAGISALRVLNEHKKIAFSSAGDLRSGWIKLKDFENLTEEQKSCIQEVYTKSERRFEKVGEDDVIVEEEWVKIKLYDKQKSLDSISKMLGYDAPQQIELGVNGSVDIKDWIASKSKTKNEKK